MTTGASIAGRKSVGDLDFYETPAWATRKALDAMLADGVLQKYDDILEPCCGAGAISKVLGEYGFANVRSSDLQTGDCIYGRRGVDVYEDIPDQDCEVIFTNPPYSLMTRENMLEEFLRIARKKVILLLNIYFLAGKSRKELLERSHLRHIYIHSDRVTMHPYGQPAPKNGGTKMFAWYVWDHTYTGRPTISWI